MQVVVPMSGSGRRFLDAGYKDPKPLLDVAGRPAIARLLERFPKDWRFVFICSNDHLRDTRLREVLLECVPDAVIRGIAPHKKGPVYAVLQAADAVDDDLPTIVNYCDFSFAWDPAGFVDFTEQTACDGAVFCYRGFQPHYLGDTMYAYCREEGGKILEIREKECFTDDRTREYASSGSYYFASGRLVKKYFQQTVDEDLNLNGEYYVSLVYNPLIGAGLTARVYEIPFFLQWGTPEDLADYLYWHRAFARLASWRPPVKAGGARLIMPMAGLGSRFGAEYPPKPLIPVEGKPMFLTARDYLPGGGAAPVLVLRRELEEGVRRAAPEAKLVVLDAPTDGQAVTTERALADVKPDEPVLVSACDHGLIWDAARWKAVVAGAPDIIVVGQRGYPGARRKPQSFAYILADDEGRVTGVSVKVPVSAAPQRDLVLVGTFYFKSAALLAELIAELKQKDLRVNGELYLDSVVGLAVERGLDVRCFESDFYLNWGSPEQLKVYEYWRDYFTGGSA
ncbi:MAG: NTP transferase domain-containing protein [Elusimicrobiota bacterium]